MSAVAHWLEAEGIATTLIALIRHHAEHSRPPRALWVPFQLGRPLGAPGNAAFQREVLRSALSLLESDEGPVVLEDFPDDEPDSADLPRWQPPLVLDALDLTGEVARLAPWYARSVEQSGRTTVGISGMTIPEAARYLAAVDSGAPLPRPRKDLSDVQCLRYAVDDLKAYYLEAVCAAGAPPSGWQLANWFFECTLAGRLVRDLQQNSPDHPDSQRRFAAWWLVPDGWLDRDSVERMRTID